MTRIVKRLLNWLRGVLGIKRVYLPPKEPSAYSKQYRAEFIHAFEIRAREGKI